jgi:D-tyrosyl-tRNA(Tyr) deacylase
VRAVVQRVARAAVSVDGRVVAGIGRGVLVLLGVAAGDREEAADWLADKLVGLRIFENEAGKFDRAVTDVGGAVLAVSQFTLHADTRKGRRPSFVAAARPEKAEPLYRRFVRRVESHGVPVRTGTFGAHMLVELVNDGPVTLIVDSDAAREGAPADGG